MRISRSCAATRPDLGRILAIDGKAINSYVAKETDSTEKQHDRRADHAARWGKKQYQGVNSHGRVWKNVTSWFGYKLHLIVDAVYELPIAYEVTAAPKGEAPVVHKMIATLGEEHSQLMEGVCVSYRRQGI